MDFRILGPLHISRDGRQLGLGGHRQKVVVCLLLLHANEVISAEQIIDVLWGEAAPETARKALQVYISRLRRILGAGVLETRAPGYLIRVPDGELDAQRFERLLAQGKQALATGDPGRAAALLRTALGPWLCSECITRIRGSSNVASNSRVLSVDPSLMMINSKSGSFCAITLAMARGSTAARLCVGRMIVQRGTFIGSPRDTRSRLQT